MTFFQGNWFWFKGPFCLNIYTLAGFWISLGVHISIWPMYVDFHVLWWCISIMSRKRGEWIHQEVADYEEITSE